MADGPVCLLLLPPAQTEAHVGCAAVPDEQGQGNGHDGQGKGHVGGGHARDPYPLPHEDLIHDIIEVVDHQRQGGGNGVAADQAANGFRFQRILFLLRLFHEKRLLSALAGPPGQTFVQTKAKKDPTAPVYGLAEYHPGLWGPRRETGGTGKPPKPLSSPIQTDCWLRSCTELAYRSRAVTASREPLISEESAFFGSGYHLPPPLSTWPPGSLPFFFGGVDGAQSLLSSPMLCRVGARRGQQDTWASFSVLKDTPKFCNMVDRQENNNILGNRSRKFPSIVMVRRSV